jgi:hypothetical protein
MANIAHRVGNAKLAFDSRLERFRDHEGADELLGKKYRRGFELKAVD